MIRASAPGGCQPPSSLGKRSGRGERRRGEEERDEGEEEEEAGTEAEVVETGRK